MCCFNHECAPDIPPFQLILLRLSTSEYILIPPSFEWVLTYLKTLNKRRRVQLFYCRTFRIIYTYRGPVKVNGKLSFERRQMSPSGQILFDDLLKLQTTETSIPKTLIRMPVLCLLADLYTIEVGRYVSFLSSSRCDK